MGCMLAKQMTLPFSTSTFVDASLFELVYSNVWYPPIVSKCSNKYHINFVDDSSHFT